MGASQSSLPLINPSSLRTRSTEPQILSSYQKVILRATWRHMSKSGQSNCGSTIMRRLFIRNDRIKNVFHHNVMIGGLLEPDSCHETHDVQEHYADIVQFLQFVISNLDYPSRINEMCHEVGLKHRKYKTMGMKTEHWDLLGEAITETIREYQGWKRHRESLRAANILVSFLVDRIRNGFLQRDVSTPIGTPTLAPKATNTTDRERSRSLQDSEPAMIRHTWTDSCPSIKDAAPSLPPTRRVSTPLQKRSLPVMSSKEARLELQGLAGLSIDTTNTRRWRSVSKIFSEMIHQRRRCLPQTPLSDGEEDSDTNGNSQALARRRHFRHSINNSFELGQLNKR